MIPLHGAIAVYDFCFFRIPNMMLLILLASILLYLPLLPGLDLLQDHLIVFGLMLILGFGLYLLKVIGAGDAKYLAVSALWIGPDFIAPFAMTVTISGGILAIIYLFARKSISRYASQSAELIIKLEHKFKPLNLVWSLGNGTRGYSPKEHSNKMPYGIAIAIGAIATTYWSMG